MATEQYRNVLLKHWRLILLCSVLVGAGVALGSFLSPPTYQSTVTVQLVIPSPTPALQSGATQALQTEVKLATSDAVLSQVVVNYPGLTTAQLKSEIAASVVSATQLFQVTVADHDAARAASLANDVAAALIAQQAQTTKESYLQVVDAAQPSSEPRHGTSWHVAVAGAGLVLGFLLGIALVLLRARLDQQIPSVAALGALTGWTVLAEWGQAAPEATETPAGADQLRQNLAFLGIDEPLFSLAVTSTPAESSAANGVAGDLAVSLASAGKRTLLVDANFSAPMQHDRFGTPAAPGLGAAVLAFSASPGAAPALEPYLYPASVSPSLLRVLPVGPVPPKPQQTVTSLAMQRVLRALGATGADVAVLAAPPVTGSAASAELAAQADGVIVVVALPLARKQALLRLKRVLEEVGANTLGCVVCHERINRSGVAAQAGVVAEVPLP
jgi:capsular polysaccharide biosynthesis protein